jgi:hypothetical protein
MAAEPVPARIPASALESFSARPADIVRGPGKFLSEKFPVLYRVRTAELRSIHHRREWSRLHRANDSRHPLMPKIRPGRPISPTSRAWPVREGLRRSISPRTGSPGCEPTTPPGAVEHLRMTGRPERASPGLRPAREASRRSASPTRGTQHQRPKRGRIGQAKEPTPAREPRAPDTNRRRRHRDLACFEPGVARAFPVARAQHGLRPRCPALHRPRACGG